MLYSTLETLNAVQYIRNAACFAKGTHCLLPNANTKYFAWCTLGKHNTVDAVPCNSIIHCILHSGKHNTLQSTRCTVHCKNKINCLLAMLWMVHAGKTQYSACSTVLKHSMLPCKCMLRENTKYSACTATKIPLMYSFSGNSAASAPISTFMCLWAIYI